RRHTRSKRDWSSDVCSSDLEQNIYFNDTNEGTIELDGGTGEEIITYTVNIRSNDSNCSSDLLRTFEFVTPKRNPYSGLLACEGEIGRASCRERVWGEGGEVA